MVPFDRIVIVHEELVKVVISLTNGQESVDQLVTRRILVVIRCVAKPIASESMQNVNNQKKKTTSQNSKNSKIPFVLPLHQRVLLKVR